MENEKNRELLTDYPLHLAILSGGAGARLWPLSSGNVTKPFLKLPYEVTLIAQAVERAAKLVPLSNIWIVTTESLTKQTLTALPQLSSRQIIEEPVGKNTAAACVLAAREIEKRAGGSVTLITLPADHYIPDVDDFVNTMTKGARRASHGETLVTFGLKVRAPKTDYGYIEAVPSKKKNDWRSVKRFIEKPPLAKAKVFAKSGKHFWNSGIFCWRTDFFLSEMKKHASSVTRPLFEQTDTVRAYEEVFATSIDYALLEKSKFVDVIPASFAWSDLGTWSSVAAAIGKKKKENIVQGTSRVVEGDGNFVRTNSKPFVLFGVDDLVIVEAENVVLVTTKEKSSDLKNLISKL